jgi:hypothetical protein
MSTHHFIKLTKVYNEKKSRLCEVKEEEDDEEEKQKEEEEKRKELAE